MKHSIAVIGCGEMGEQILSHLVQAYPPGSIVITRNNKKRGQTIARRHGVHFSSSNSQAVAEARLIFLCIRPQNFSTVLPEIAPHISSPVVVSIAAAISQSYIKKRLPTATVLRYMPSPLISERKGVALLVHDTHHTPAGRVVKLLTSWSSMVHTLSDREMHAYTILTSCGSAFVSALMANILETIGVTPTHKKILTQVFNDTIVSLAQRPAKEWKQIAARASTPGGITAEGIRVINSPATTTLIKKTLAHAERQSRRIQKKSEK